MNYNWTSINGEIRPGATPMDAQKVKEIHELLKASQFGIGAGNFLKPIGGIAKELVTTPQGLFALGGLGLAGGMYKYYKDQQPNPSTQTMTPEQQAIIRRMQQQYRGY
jgi:hypothetical protein